MTYFVNGAIITLVKTTPEDGVFLIPKNRGFTRNSTRTYAEILNNLANFSQKLYYLSIITIKLELFGIISGIRSKYNKMLIIRTKANNANY